MQKLWVPDCPIEGYLILDGAVATILINTKYCKNCGCLIILSKAT